MRLVAILSLILVCACGRPVSGGLSPEPLTPIAHLSGTIGPVDEIDTNATATLFDDGVYFSATLNATHAGTAVMTRLAASDASVITAPMERAIFTFGDESGISAIGCAGSAEGQWDIIDAPADVVVIEVDEAGIATVEMVLRNQTEPVIASFSTSR
jgi:hypothetical protein